MAKLWVIDTSSILEIRRPNPLKIPKARQPAVYTALTALVDEGVLVYPKQVLDELERQTAVIAATGERDLPYEWAKQNAEMACRFDVEHAKLREVLAVDGVEDLLDPDKPGVEPADPYVLALAHQLRDEYEPSVITEDRKNAPDKIGLASAVGLLHLPVVPIRAFLLTRKIWRVPG